MKANELMIEDWVLHDRDPYQIRQLGIYGVDRDGEDYPAVCIGKPNGVGLIVERNEIEPIPLTPEILEKNGFNLLRDAYEMSDPFWSYSNRNVLVDITIIRTNNVKVIDWFNVKISTRNSVKQISFDGVKYVHELQHAMRLCEIEKEIML